MVETKKIKTLDWPVILLTLTPLENISKLLKTMFRNKNFPKTIDEEWSKFNISIIKKVMDSIPQRIKTALDTKGDQLSII